MKKAISIFLVTLLMICSAFALVGCGENGKQATQKAELVCKTEEGGYVVYEYNGKATDLKLGELVKSTYGEDAKVIKIKEGAFDGNATIVNLEIPETVTKIEAGAFKNMKKVVKIQLPFVGLMAKADSFANETGDGEKAVKEERLFGYVFGKNEYEGGAKITMQYNESSESTLTTYIPMTLREVVIAPATEYTLPAYAFAGLTQVSKVTLTDKVTVSETAFYNAEYLNPTK